MSYIGPISIAAGSRIVGPSGGGGGNPAGPNCVLLLHGDGTNGSTTFTDDSGQGHVPVAVGAAQLSTAQKKFGTASMFFDGTTACIDLDGSADFSFGTGDFTIDMWIYPTDLSTYHLLFSYGSGPPAAGFYCYVFASGQVIWNVPGAGDTTNVIDVAQNAWSHVAFVRAGTTLQVYVNGVASTGPGSSSNSIATTAGYPVIGSRSSGSADLLYQGYIDELRVLKGRAAWTASFTPPTAPYS
jgi:hypothetical protein